jgi:hypothetical protein
MMANFLRRRGRPIPQHEIDETVALMKRLRAEATDLYPLVQADRSAYQRAVQRWLNEVHPVARKVTFAMAELREEARNAALRGITDDNQLQRIGTRDLIAPAYSLTQFVLIMNTVADMDEKQVADIGGTYVATLLFLLELIPDDAMDKLEILAPVRKLLPDWLRASVYAGTMAVAVTMIDGLTNVAYLDEHLQLVRPPAWNDDPSQEQSVVLEMFAKRPSRYRRTFGEGQFARMHRNTVRGQLDVARRYGPAVVAASALHLNTTPFVAAEMAGRDVVFLGSSVGSDGFAIRASPGGVHDSTILKGADRDSMVKLRALERDARRRRVAGQCSWAEYHAAIWSLVLKIGALVIEPIVSRWPDLKCLTLVPIGTAFGLPYGVAHLAGEYHRCGVRVTTCPSVRTMLISSLSTRGASFDQRVFVGGDAAQGKSRIPFVIDEIDAIARMWNVSPTAFNRESPCGSAGEGQEARIREISTADDPDDAEPSPDWLLTELAEADLVHLSCHGHLASDGRPRANLLFNGVLDMSAVQKTGFKPGSTVILSACSVGGFDSRYSSEILGFPTAILGAGARNVIASIWPVPDSLETVNFMSAIHDGLFRGESPEVAFDNAVAEAIDGDVPASVWAGYSLFGV